MQTPSDRSIVVLPFVNRSKDPENEYFSDGMTEEIINALTRVEGLKVIARTSSFAFKGKNIDVREIGRQLGVTTVLEGSVRKSKKRLRITAQLIDTQDGTHLWSQTFDRELVDIFALQDEVSLLIADRLRENFGHFELQEQLIIAPTQNIDAYNLYLKARYHHLKWDSAGIRTAIELYKMCIDIAPEFALPYFGIGYCYAMAGSWGSSPALLTLAQQFLDRGFRIDDQSALGYFGKATLAFWGHWDFKEGQTCFQQAIELNPSYTEAKEGLAELYSAAGYFEEAAELAQQILSINPLSPNHFYTKGNISYLQGEFSAALAHMNAALQLDPQFSHAIVLKQLCLLHLQEHEQLALFLKTQPGVEQASACKALYQLLHPNTFPGVDPQLEIQVLTQSPTVNLFPWPIFLQTHLKQHDLALDLLTAAVETRTGQVVNFRYTPLLRPLHNHPQFQSLVQSIFSDLPLPTAVLATPTPTASNRKALLTDKEVQALTPRLQQLIEVDQVYLDSALSLRSLAEHLKLSSNKLSWLINEHLGQNFNEYINDFRLHTFKKLAIDPKNRHLTLLAIAYDSGFNSKTVFNAFFKKREGNTPSAWVKMQRRKLDF